MVPSPKSQLFEVAWPETCPTKSTRNPVATLVNVWEIATSRAPVADAALNSSAPIDGGLSHVSPSISTPPAANALPAPRHGEAELMWKESANNGSLVILFAPFVGSGVVSQ